MQSNNNTLVAGVLTAIGASLCCITPLLGLIAGASGMASAFAWLEPARPFLIGFTVIVLGFAWYQKLKPRSKEAINCVCDADGENNAIEEKPSFLQSKKFLGIITVFAGLMLSFPLYAHIFYPQPKTNVVIMDNRDIAEANLQIEGMTCTGCEAHIKHTVAKLPGFVEASVNWKQGTATVKFDKTKIQFKDIVTAIDESGYTVTSNEVIETPMPKAFDTEE